jgi:NAD(P)-dependent dehydrogenase (short-subunit alcohol dehydrogenase family)
MGELDGKVALVTGAGQGSGRGIALALADAGAAVAVVGRTVSKLDDVVAEIERRGAVAQAVRCDVHEPSEIDDTVTATLARFGTVDVLVNAAHHNSRKNTLLDVSDEEIELLWTTGPRATLRFMRRCHPHLRGGGSIVNFGSGTQFSPQQYGVYAGMKEAIWAISRAAAVEWGPDQIRVNVISPLASSPTMDAGYVGAPERYGELLGRIPLRRVGDPESDVGQLAVFLSSPAASYVTGQLICVDGGQAYHR